MFYLAVGYAICVLFPIPFLNSFIIGLWAKFGSQIEAWIKGSNLPVPEPTVSPTPAPATTARKEI